LLRQPLTFEHVYAADWNTTHHGSKKRNEFSVPAYGSAEEDLHNRGPSLVPSTQTGSMGAASVVAWLRSGGLPPFDRFGEKGIHCGQDEKKLP
jgi:hypothetical protein